jgi:hypothetical protein
MKLTTQQLALLFPQAGKNKAITGNIPMKFFRYFETEIAEIMKEDGLKKYYRGGRYSNAVAGKSYPMTTVRCDAHSVKLYVKA